MSDNLQQLVAHVAAHPDKQALIDVIDALMKQFNLPLEDQQAVDKFFNGQAVSQVDVQQIIAILKTVCSVIDVLDKSVCPIINGL